VRFYPRLRLAAWRENTTWGQITIAAECGRLGSPRTVAKYRPRRLDRSRGQAWSTFVRNHLSQIWACDFLTIVSFRFQVLCGFPILALERRQIMHVGVTVHPTAEWAAQRVVEAVRHRGPHASSCTIGIAFTARLFVVVSAASVFESSLRHLERRLPTLAARASSARFGAIASITCSSGTTAKLSDCCASMRAIMKGGPIAVSACNLPPVRNGFRQRSLPRSRQCREQLFSAASTIATSPLPMVLRSLVSAPNK
jgi:hypothetical protein